MASGDNGDVYAKHNGYIDVQGQKWDKCYICGVDCPKRQMRRHHKLGKLVCPNCQDEIPNKDGN